MLQFEWIASSVRSDSSSAANSCSTCSINENVRRVVRLFRWGVANELVRPTRFVHWKPLKDFARADATLREGKTVKPVPWADVEATLPHLPTMLADVVRLQQLTGARPSEILNLRPSMIDRSSSDVWTCRLDEHKTANAGKDRTIFLGPQAKSILAPYLLRPADAACFSPAESERRRQEDMHSKRRTPLRSGNRPGMRRSSKADRGRRTGKRREFREFYTSHRYYVAVVRAAAKAGVTKWTPYQLRHTRATELRAQFGLEGAQSVLGHSELRTTQTDKDRFGSLRQ